MSPFRVLFAFGLLAVACGDDAAPPNPSETDAGVDAGRPDATERRDAGTRADGGTGRRDVGFDDPSVIAQGKESIGPAALFVTARGTMTSTMPPLLILPTGPMHGQEYLWEPTEFLLGPGGRERPNRLLVYMDPRATGQSSWGAINDAELNTAVHLRDVEGLVAWVDDLLGAERKVDFLGHGYGAGLAALYTAAHPERVSRLVLSNPFPIDVRDHARWIETYQSRLDSAELRRLNEIQNWRTCIQSIPQCSLESWDIFGPSWMCTENEPEFQEMTFEYLDFRTFDYYLNRSLRNERYDWSGPLGRIVGIPTTIISGPCDPIPEHTPLTYTASIAGSVRHVVPGSGHFTLVERPDEFRRIVTRALTY